MTPIQPRASAAALSVSEAAFQQSIVDLATWTRWRSYHTFDSRHSVAGFPDLVLVRGVDLIFAELKAASGRVSVEQRDWLADLQLVAAAVAAVTAGRPDEPRPSIEVVVWRPADFSQIRERLTRPRRRVVSSSQSQEIA